MALDLELLLIFGLLVTVVLILAYYRRTVRSLKTQLEQKQTGADRIRIHQGEGRSSSASRNLRYPREVRGLSPPLDDVKASLVGPDRCQARLIDLLEFRKKGGTLQSGERRIKQLIDEKVGYRILVLELPETALLRDRPK